MSERKTLPPQQTLTQMSRNRSQRRLMDGSLISSIMLCQKREHNSVRTKAKTSRRTVPVSESHILRGFHYSSSDSDESRESLDSDYVSEFVPKRPKRPKRYKYEKPSKTQKEEESVAEAVVLSDDAPLSPCLLPVVEFTPTKDKVGVRSSSSEGEEAPPPKKKYLDVTTQQWISKHNRVLKRARHYERQCKYERRRASYYKRKLWEINEISRTVQKEDSD